MQEASGKTSHLSRADRAVLKEIDGKTALQNIAVKFEKIPADKFDALIAQFDKDGYIREVSSGATAPQATTARTAPPSRAAPPPPPAGGDDEMDFTQAIKLPPRPAAPAAPKAPVMDLAAAARAEAERKEKEQQAFDFRTRQEAEAKAKAQAEAKAKADAEARARALAEAKARAEAEAKAKAEAEARARAAAAANEAKTLAEAEAKVKAAREAAIRMATEVKAKAEAEAKAKADELTGKLEAERKAREEAEKRASEAAESARKELEEKARRDAEELRQRLEAEMKAKLEEERRAREEEDRKRREEEDRRRKEEDERRAKEEAERRAKEEAERRAREEEERKRREEEDRRRKEEDERRAKEEAERRAKEDAERRAREEADRKRREEEDRKRAEEDKRRKEDEERRAKEQAEQRAKEEAERKAKDDAERRAREDAERRAREDAERKAKEEAERKAKDDAERRAKDDAERRAKDDAERRAKDEAEAKARAASAQSSSTPSIAPVAAPPPPPPASDGGLGDSLLADLESFGQREEEEQRAKEEAERKAKEEAARKGKAESERKAREEAERKAREEADRKRRDEEERKAQEDAERQAREDEERQKQEEAERKRKAKESLAAKEAERKAAQGAVAAKVSGKEPARDDDIEVSDDDLDMDDVKKDEKALSATARKAARERELATTISAAPAPRPKKWGKPAAIALFVILIGGVAALQLMPVSTADYEKAASEAMGVPVKIGSAKLSVITGIEARFENVSVGSDVKISKVRGFPEVGTLFGGKKTFSRIELEGVSLSQSQLADAVLGKVSGENFRVSRVLIKQAKLDGPLALPALDIDATVSGDGSLQSVSLKGGDKLIAQLSPKGNEIGFEISAGSLPLPFAPALTLSEFGMKGTANRAGVTMSEFDGRAYDGIISGTAKIRWGSTWTVDGEIRARGIKVAVLAPTLVSEGKADGRGAYSMSGANPATLFESARIQGEFKIDKGVLGSFDLTRALQTGGAQSTGRTIFSELTGQALYDKGVVRITNASIAAGAMNAGASLDIDAGGGLSGRVVADVKMPNQTLRATLNISGKIQDPVIRK